MNNPIKIIYKAKNDNGKPQYYVYVYVGKIPDNIFKILEKMRELSLYDTLMSLQTGDIDDIVRFYGDKWFTYFFNKHHISKTFNDILTNTKVLSDIANKFGQNWVNANITGKYYPKQQSYTYGSIVKRQLIHHELRTHKGFEFIPTNNETYILGEHNDILRGGGDEDEVNDTNDDVEYEQLNDTEPDDIAYSDDDEMELEQAYAEAEQTTNDIEKTTSLIKKIMEDENILKKKESKMIKFDTSKDTNIYKENIAEVFAKKYVTEQYIFVDDTIKTIKNKICMSIKINPKFGKKAYIIPTRQYIWGEYLYGKTYEKIMIGIKWTQRNGLLNIDIEPNDNMKVYEELRDTIRNLRNDMKHFNSKIRRDDDDNNILLDYSGYYDNNELYMIDIYNEFGKKYSLTADALTNVMDTYVKIYYPKLSIVDVKNIIDFLNENPSNEREKIIDAYDNINVDMMLENEIVNVVEKIKYTTDYRKIMKENYVTQSMIQLLLKSDDTNNFRRINMFRIYDGIIPNATYPFVQYMSPDGNVSFKFNEEEMAKYAQNKNVMYVVSAWFQNVSYGISFKIRTDDMSTNNPRFMTVNLSDLGRVDYKIQWKEADKASIGDIAKTHSIIVKLITEINNTSIRKKFEIPSSDDFKTAFITTIQRFEFESEHKINHNDLSRFARYFYPYFALVIEPKKRVSKTHEDDSKSKFGTYLRYKRISKYENVAKIEQRIYYFIKNYEYTDQLIINEISKQFNITREKAEEHLKKTLQKYTHIKKARKALKKFDASIKYKSPGIDIAIQGKTKDKYKIRISGARDKQQLERIVTSLNVMLYLYYETYIAKNPEWQYLKDKLRKLNNIAERRHTVNDFVKYSDEKMNIKAMANMDKRRIGYKPEKGQSHWSRVCQNSGNTQRRRPQLYTVDNIDDMLKLGYAYNKATGMYERKYVTKKNGKMITQTLKAVKLNELDDQGKPIGNEIYYTCSPEQNGIHMYVGFLTRSKNPFGEFMPCCFKKDQANSNNQNKRKFFMRCIGKSDDDSGHARPTFSDQLYILQDTNKIQPKRFGFLPKLLDFYLNGMLNAKRVIAQHYLVSAPSGYFFKYGIEHGDNSFLSAISNSLDMSLDDIMNNINKSLNNDTSDTIFTFLNNGETRNKFGTREKYIEHLKKITDINYADIVHLLTIPNVVTEGGFSVIIFSKFRNIVGNTERYKDNFRIVCQNSEELNDIFDATREIALLYEEHEKYYPIYCVTKTDNTSKNISIQKTFSYSNKTNNIIEHIKDFYNKNCMKTTIGDTIGEKTMHTAKDVCKILRSQSVVDYLPKYQYVDTKNKCRYIITNNMTIIPTQPSGSVYDVEIISNLKQYIDTYTETRDKVCKFNKVFGNKFMMSIIGVHGSDKNDKNDSGTFVVESLVLDNNEKIPVKQETIRMENIKKDKMLINTDPSYDNIDTHLMNPSGNVVIDQRISSVTRMAYMNESYELFRYALSDYLNIPTNKPIKNRIIKILGSEVGMKEKNTNIRMIMYTIIDERLARLYATLTHQNTKSDMLNGGKKETIKSDELGKIFPKVTTTKQFIHIIDKEPNTSNYKMNNIRELCSTKKQQKCSDSIHCDWTRFGCVMALTKKMVIMFVNKVSTELADGGLKSSEILQLDGHYVSDVVDNTRYTERENQKVIKSSKENIRDAIENYFGKGQLFDREQQEEPHVVDMFVKEYPLKDYGNRYAQTIIGDNNTILRAYANGLHWIENEYQDKYVRNLGYYSQKQTDIMVYLKSLIIDWVVDKKNSTVIEKLLQTHTNFNSVYKYVTKLAVGNETIDVELCILNNIQKIPVVLYKNGVISKVFDDGMINETVDDGKYDARHDMINIQTLCDDTGSHTRIMSVETVYYKQ